jgi:hypothetical protein
MSVDVGKGSKQQRRLSGVCSLGGAAVELDMQFPVPVCRRGSEKVQWPKGLARRRRKFSRDLLRRKSSPSGFKKNLLSGLAVEQ